MNEYRTDLWTVNPPEHWEAYQEDDYTVIHDPDGVGALHISSFTKDGDVTRDDLEAFAAEYADEDITVSDVEYSNFSGINFDYTEDNNYWQIWFLKSENLMLFITYNSAALDKGFEDEEIGIILNSLAVVTDNPE